MLGCYSTDYTIPDNLHFKIPCPLTLLLTVDAVSLPGLIDNVSVAAHIHNWQRIYNLHLIQSTD